MSQRPISLSADLRKLRSEGYDLEVRSGYLLIKDVPYVNSKTEIKRGTLVVKLMLANDVTVRPDNHVAHFAGEYPCRGDGKAIEKIRNSSKEKTLADDVVIQHTFSAKPKPQGHYEDYYTKVTAYVAILSAPAQSIDSTVTAKTFSLIDTEGDDDDEPFHYIDTASSRAEIDAVARKLSIQNVAIVGLGGTGSYVLDLVAKTPVKKIHLFDGDGFLQHNAFRSPGAPSGDDLKARQPKTTYFHGIYSKMHRGIVDHAAYVDESNIEVLQNMDFVFLCLDHGPAKKFVVEKLEAFNLPFIDVGMGIQVTDDALGGILRVTMSTPKKRDHLRGRISFGNSDGNNEYDQNIQVADLNALNAALAVMKWKKHYGFYRDLKGEHNSLFTIDGNQLLNEECDT